MNSQDFLSDILEIFKEIAQIPRCSGHEGKIREYIKGIADKNKIEYKEDTVGNLLLVIPPTKGCEDKEGFVLQSHMDMVCQKDAKSTHDFSKDPIEVLIDGDWIHANGTTLGADNGVGIAMSLAIARSKEIPHPELELLFTVDEETGLTGALSLSPDMISKKMLLNLDSEEDWEITIGSAGSRDTIINGRYTEEKLVGESFEIRIVNGIGGHSGTDIGKKIANTNVVLARLLSKIMKSTPLSLINFLGGSARNVIPRSSSASFVMSKGELESLEKTIREYEAEVRKEYSLEKEIAFEILKVGLNKGMSQKDSKDIINLLSSIPNGVIEMSTEVKGLVQTSNNIGVVCIENGGIEIVSMTRSFNIERVKEVTSKIGKLGERLGFSVTFGNISPNWEPDTKSFLLKKVKESYVKLFKAKPGVSAVHAGLECGAICSKYPGMQAVSIGSTLSGAHSPSEKASIKSIEKVGRWVIKIIS